MRFTKLQMNHFKSHADTDIDSDANGHATPYSSAHSNLNGPANSHSDTDPFTAREYRPDSYGAECSERHPRL